MEIRASVSLKLKELAKNGDVPHDLLGKMFNNFKVILDNGHGLDGLPGKYKPSWDFDKSKAGPAHNQYGINEIIAITDKLSKAESIKKGYKQKILDNIYVEMQYWDIL